MANFPGRTPNEDLLAKANTEVIVKSTSDLPTPVLAPDGFMRHKLAKDTCYNFDIANETFTLTNGFWIEDVESTFLQATSLHSLCNTQIVYTATNTLFYAESLSFFSLHRIVWIAGVPGTQLFDMQGSIDPGTISVVESTTSSFLGFNLGRLVNIGANKLSFVASLHSGPIRLHNSPILSSLRDMTFNTLTYGATGKPCVVFTGAFANITVDNLKPVLQATDSFLAIDAGASIDSKVYIQHTGFSAGEPFDFFEADLTGSLTQFQDLSVLISGTASAYETAANGQVKVTHDGTASVNIGSSVTHSGTTNYNGTFKVVQLLGLNAYVMDATYVADEVSGSFVGSGTRVTTSVPHNFYEFRTVTVSGTTNYDGAYEAHNAGASTFDISAPFVADDATGSFLVESLDKTSLDVDARANGALPDSISIAAIGWHENTAVISILDGTYVSLDLGTVELDAAERFTLVDTTTGRLRCDAKEGFCGIITAALNTSPATAVNSSYRYALSIDQAVPVFGTDDYLPVDLKQEPDMAPLVFFLDIAEGQTVEFMIAGDGTTNNVTITDGHLVIR